MQYSTCTFKMEIIKYLDIDLRINKMNTEKKIFSSNDKNRKIDCLLEKSIAYYIKEKVPDFVPDWRMK